MADMGQVKIYFLENISGTSFQDLTGDGLPEGFKAAVIASVDGDVVTTSVPHGLYPDTLITPSPMALFVDDNDPGAPGSRAVDAVDAYQIRLKSALPGIAAGQRVAVFRWVERSNLLKAGSLRINRQNDHSDGAEFEILTQVGGFMPYAGMNVLVKYGSGFTLFGGIVRSADLSVAGRYKGASSRLVAAVKADTYAAIAKRRVILSSSAWKGATAGSVVQELLQIMQQEGVSEGRIDDGEFLLSFPSEKIGSFTILALLDKLAKLSGYRWYINPDKALFFVPQEAVYNPDSQAWEPFVGEAPYNISDSGEFDDYGGLSLSTGIEYYCNTLHLKGGSDINKREVYVVGRDDDQILLTQLRTGGSGVWGGKTEMNDVNLLVQKTVEQVSQDGIITITGHELCAGDYIVNIRLNYLATRVKQVIDPDSFTVMGDIDVAIGSLLGWYPQGNAIVRSCLKNYGEALPKVLQFDTFTIGNSRIWVPMQRIDLDLAAFGEAGKGSCVSDSVEYMDVGGELKIRVTASLRGSSFFE